MTSVENSYSKVKTRADLDKFLAFWASQLKDISLNAVISKEGAYYINTSRGTPKGRLFKVDLISRSEFERIARKYAYNLTKPKNIMNNIARIAELIALKKIARILEKYSAQLPKPILKACFGKEHALYDINIPFLNLYIDVKSNNVYTSEVYDVLKKRATLPNNGETMYFTQNISPDKINVLEMIEEYKPIDYLFYSFAIAIDYPGHIYHDVKDEDILSIKICEKKELLQATSLDGEIITLSDMLEYIKGKRVSKFYVVKKMTKFERGFLEDLDLRIRKYIEDNPTKEE